MACMGEIKLFAFNFAPIDWKFCDGALLTTANNQHLASLLGSTYGGDGINTFALPDMRERVPIGIGRGEKLSKYWQLGEKFGEEKVRLTDGNLPSHSHCCYISNDEGNTDGPESSLLSSAKGEYKIYSPLENKSKMMYMHSDSITHTGENLPHENMMPSMALNYCICTNGIDPRGEEEDEPFVGEIKIFANNFAPLGFMQCHGSQMSINDYNYPLFSLIQYTFGRFGNNFSLPDLRGKVVAHRGAKLWFTESIGFEYAELTPLNTPSHNHYMKVSSQRGTESVPLFDVVPAIGNIGSGFKIQEINIYCNDEKKTSKMSQIMLQAEGFDEKHENRQPYLALNYCICVDGNFPFHP